MRGDNLQVNHVNQQMRVSTPGKLGDRIVKTYRMIKGVMMVSSLNVSMMS